MVCRKWQGLVCRAKNRDLPNRIIATFIGDREAVEAIVNAIMVGGIQGANNLLAVEEDNHLAARNMTPLDLVRSPIVEVFDRIVTLYGGRAAGRDPKQRYGRSLPRCVS